MFQVDGLVSILDGSYVKVVDIWIWIKIQGAEKSEIALSHVKGVVRVPLLAKDNLNSLILTNGWRLWLVLKLFVYLKIKRNGV